MRSNCYKDHKKFMFGDYKYDGLVQNVYFIKDGKIYEPVINLFHAKDQTKFHKCFKFPVELYYRSPNELRYIGFVFDDIEKTTIVVNS